MTFTSNIDFQVCVVLLLLVNVASKFGDALAPSLVDTSPLLLIALNANDLHLALTAAGHQVTPVGFVPYFVVGVARRLLEDPLYYYLGWMYGTKAVDWLEVRTGPCEQENSPRGGGGGGRGRGADDVTFHSQKPRLS